MRSMRAKIVIMAGHSPQIDILSDALKSAGYDLRWVESTSEARMALSESGFDLFLADVESVDVNKDDLQMIRDSCPDLRIILITSGTGTTAHRTAGVNGTVTRPYRISHIEDIIKEILADETVSPEKNTVLVVDDDDAFRAVLVRSLRLSGYEVQAATDGKMALELIDRGGIKAVIADVNMPLMDGITLTRRIKTEYPDTPVILITGYFSPEDFSASADIVADGFIMKPFKIKHITEILDKL